LIVVEPEYVFAPDNVSVPVPDFVNVPEPVVIAAIDDVPTLSTVNPMSVPVTPPDNVNDEPVSICTSDAANIVTAPEIVFVPLVLRIAPTSANASVTPSPVISIGSKTVTPLEIDNVALFATVVLPRVPAFSPSAVLLLIATTPVEIVVSPVYVLAFDNVNVPVPNFVNVPEPVVIAAIDDVPTLSTVNPKLLPVTPPDNVNDEPVSICTSDAANIVTAPEIVLVPPVLRIAPLLDTPVPVISIGSVTVKVPDNDNAALSATVVLPRVPALSPSAVLLLIATTPVEIVVSPVYVLALDNVNVLLADVFFVNVPEPEITPDNV
jgi:hypothetical protein